MVETRSFQLEADILVKIPIDILQNTGRLEAVRDGLKKALTIGLYEQGVDFEIRNLKFKAK